MTSETGQPRRWREAVILAGVGCFLLQTGFVYFDGTPSEQGRALSAQAREGLALWRRHNCQACHQIYGFGGFLGPDLTNVMAQRPYEDWTDILTRGRKQMPAFEFEEPHREAIVAFLTEVGATGTGVPRLTAVRDGMDLDAVLRTYVEAAPKPPGEAVRRGHRIMEDCACRQCHVPFGVGTQGAPDLTQALSVRSPEYVRTILKKSKGAMPAYEFLGDEQITDIMACLAWMNENRRELGRFCSGKENGADFRWAAVPWFEY